MILNPLAIHAEVQGFPLSLRWAAFFEFSLFAQAVFVKDISARHKFASICFGEAVFV
jgi:hypothetical protein